MKNIIICLILGACLFLGFWGVNFHNQNSNQVVIQFASWGSESEINILKPILRDFENKNPGVKIDFMHIPQNYFQKIHLLFASNTAPDVIFINNQYLPIYANAGVLEDLSNFDFTNFYPKSVEAMKWNGKIYAVPRDISNMVVFYNKDLLKKHSIPYPNDDWDLQEFLSNAKKLTQLPDIFGVSFDVSPNFYLPYLTTCGEWTKYDTQNFFQKNINDFEGLKFYGNLRGKYHVAPRAAESASATMAQMFLQQRIAMHISGRWLVPKYREEAKFDWDVAEFPSCKKNEKSVVPMDSSGWAVSKSSKHKYEALKLVKFLASRESCEKFTSGGLITPARIDVANSKIFLNNKKPKNSKIFLKVAETSVPTPVTLNYNEILDNLKSKTEIIFNEDLNGK